MDEKLKQLRDGLNKILIGQAELVDQLLAALIAGGHVLIEGVPGLGKTLLVQALSMLSGSEFKRIQFTPDLMPADIVGTTVFSPVQGSFTLKKGPVFTNLLLADEINRSPAKTQAALLEALQEGQVTIDGATHPLPPFFLCLATQNPLEMEGTYPLPEAQLDRFLMKLKIGYPTEEGERKILDLYTGGQSVSRLPLGGLLPVCTAEDFLRWRDECSRVLTDEKIRDYVVAAVRTTRKTQGVAFGVSPRGAVALLGAARAVAYLEGRDFVIPEDVKQAALPVLRHRVLLEPEYELEGVEPDQVISGIMGALPVPR